MNLTKDMPQFLKLGLKGNKMPLKLQIKYVKITDSFLTETENS